MFSGKLRFVLGILRHPDQAWPRLREMYRIITAPPESSIVPTAVLPDVSLIPVTQTDALGATLVEMYAANPSPFVSGPTGLEELERSLNRGIRYFLVANDRREIVGARAFDPQLKLLQSIVTDYRFRGHGYQLGAGKVLIGLLAKEGHEELRVAVYRGNTRMLRTLAAEGWQLKADPANPALIVGTLYQGKSMGSESIEIQGRGKYRDTPHNS